MPKAANQKWKRPARGHDEIRRPPQGAVANLRRVCGFAPRAVRFQNHRQRTRGDSAQLRDLPGFAARMAAAGGLFREAAALAQGFPRHELVAEIVERAGQGAAGGAGVFIFAREAFRAAGIVSARQPGPFCQGRGGRAGSEARAGAGTLARAARAAAARHAARHAPRRLPRAGGRGRTGASPARGAVSIVASAHGREGAHVARDD